MTLAVHPLGKSKRHCKLSSVHESMFLAAARPLHDQQTGVAVRFRRGMATSESFTARRSEEVERDPSLDIDVTVRKYMLPIDKVLINSVQVEPRTGDEILEGDNVFEILPSDGGPPSVTKTIGNFDWQIYTKKTSAN
jgi:hypothetical protein